MLQDDTDALFSDYVDDDPLSYLFKLDHANVYSYVLNPRGPLGEVPISFDLLESLDLCDAFWDMASDRHFGPDTRVSAQTMDFHRPDMRLDWLLSNGISFSIKPTVVERLGDMVGWHPQYSTAIYRQASCIFHVRIADKEQAAIFKLFNR